MIHTGHLSTGTERLIPWTSIIAIVLGISTLITSATDFRATSEPASHSSVSFNQSIRPILSENCFTCHGPDENKRKAHLRLDLFEEATRNRDGHFAIVPGHPEQSELWRRITSDDQDEMMPPPESHRTLRPEQRETLQRWIAEGAHYETHWAFTAPCRPSIPQPKNRKWVKNPIDAFILARMEREGLSPNPSAPPRILLRRLSLDLTGLPPTLELLDDFGTRYTQDADAAIAMAVNRMLTSPHYGERMALTWLDAARYSDSNGFQQDGNRHQWPWRDWVVQAYNRNMPFDQFTIEQIAGDLLPNPNRDQLIATAFNRNHMLNGEGGAIAEEQRVNNVLDRVDTTATTWLALTMACAQCHTHKYDPITQEEYYRFYAFFNNLPESGVIDFRSGQGCAFGSGATVQLARPWLSLPTKAQEVEKAQLEAEIKQIDQKLDEMEKSVTPSRQTWEASFSAKELEDRTRFPGSLSGLLRLPQEKRNQAQRRTATEFFLQNGNHQNPEWKRFGEEVMTKLDALRRVNESILQIMIMEENSPEKKRQTHIFARGAYTQPGKIVTPGTPAFLPPLPSDRSADRLALAHWLTRSDHPLTARVAVNRIWQQIFSVGIVKTSEDFGVQGEQPTHPELLDWLAVEFMESGWDVKHIIRLITGSNTYRQDSVTTQDKRERDPENRLLSRSSRSRLPAMILRDQALSIGGLLVPTVGGEPVYPRQPSGLWEEFSFGKISYPVRKESSQLYRRSIYSFFRRTSAPPNLFDMSARQVCIVKPSTTNTPLHALVTLNDETWLDASRGLARYMIAKGGLTPLSRVTLAFQLATARNPTARELNLLVQGYERSMNTFGKSKTEAISYAGLPTDTTQDPVPLAACVRTAQVILNLDETLCRP